MDFRRLIFLYTLFIACQLSLFAQETGRIIGTVADGAGNPLPYATAVVTGSRGAVADENGRFTITGVPSGSRELSVSAVGYATCIRTVNVAEDAPARVACVCTDNPLQLASISVNAEKRVQAAQRVAGSVAVADGERLEALQISNIVDVGRITPNFQSYNDGGGAFPFFASRGVSTIDESPVVGVYVDDVPLFNTRSMPALLYDVERVEILKGPQGTLYGRNSLGGIINIVTRPAGNTRRGFLRAEYGSFNQYEIGAGFSAPLVEDKLFLRLSGAVSGRDGYITNVFDGNDVYGRNVSNVNARLKYLPGGPWSIDLTTSLEHRRVDGYALIGGFFNGSAAAIDSLVNNHPYESNQNTVGEYRTWSSNNALRLGYRGEKLTFSSVSAVQYTLENVANDDFDATPFDLNQTNDRTPILTLSQEFRLSGPTDGKLTWLAGFYGYRVTNDLDRRITNGADNAFFLPDPSLAVFYPHDDIQRSEITQLGAAVFGQLDYHPTDRLTITGGLRAETERSELAVDQTFELNGELFEEPFIGAVADQFGRDVTFSAVSPKLAMSFQAGASNLLYGSVKRGYRPGGVNPFVNDADQATFDPEFSWNYEIGLKNTLWDGRARLNMTAFLLSYDDQQLFTVLDPLTLNFGRRNIGNARHYGFEVESEMLLTKGLSLIANAAYLEAEITNYEIIGFAGEIDNAGNQVPVAPRFTGNVGLSYRRQLGNAATSDTPTTLGLTVDYQFQSGMFFDAENTYEQPGFGLLNAQVSLGRGRYELSLWGRNLTDEVYLGYGYSVAGAGIFANFGLPRELGATLAVKF